jgi:hypothetical protein
MMKFTADTRHEVENILHSSNLKIPLNPPLQKGDLLFADRTIVKEKLGNLYHAQVQRPLPTHTCFPVPPFEKGGLGGISSMHLMHDPLHLLREPRQKDHGDAPDAAIEDETEKRPAGPEKFILCRQCTQLITSSDERISVDGSHEHTFANPHGVVFDIACFRSVTGCGYAGPPSEEFTWFKGFRWRIAVCGMCLTHLGWLFQSDSGYSFHGLIRNRIVETSGD